ncbi:MAG TPA: L-threonylcarbamoyladenylate synthase [Candidatus Limnocylindrales bacterium]|nr:L-threonylcarbamoyladenylate synthase [Candidatus Limnocylindrales bacterium]
MRNKARDIIKNGGIVIFPTDTAFGIGCRMDDEKAVARLFKIRNRPETKATPVLVSGIEMAKDYWSEIPDLVIEKLIKPYWPGALTIVLQCQTEKVPGLVRGGGNTLGLRMPNNQKLLDLIDEVGVPIVGTSANFAGDPTPYSYDDLNPELKKIVDFVEKGECKTKEASTVIDCSQIPWRILRQGAVKISIKS